MGTVTEEAKTIYELLEQLANASGNYDKYQCEVDRLLAVVNELQDRIDACIEGMKKSAPRNTHWFIKHRSESA